MDTLEALRLYVTIAETGSFSAAARQVSVSTSTVTVALQQLEEQARVSLTTRSTRRLSFTFEGRRFLADARKLLADWDASIAGVSGWALARPNPDDGHARFWPDRSGAADRSLPRLTPRRTNCAALVRWCRRSRGAGH